MKKLLACALITLSVSPAMAQEIMTFGHAPSRPAAGTTYTKTRIPRGSTVVVKNPNECTTPTMYIGQSIRALDNMRFNKPIRIIRPGEPMSMDHNPQRLNFMLDENDMIRNIMCG